VTPFLPHREGWRAFVVYAVVRLGVRRGGGGWLMLFFFSIERMNLDRLVVLVQ
jgi:hypothetical protein